MVRTSRTTGEPRAVCSKIWISYPSNLGGYFTLLTEVAKRASRPGTGLVSSKAAALRLTLVSRFTAPGNEASSRLFPLGLSPLC